MAEEKNKDLYQEAQELIGKERIEDVVELENSQKKEQAVTPSDDQQKIREHLESVVLDDDSKMQAQTHANDLQSLETTGKLEKLLQVAKQKGVIFAVAVAKKMNDPYILDILHDTLANQGHYRNFKF